MWVAYCFFSKDTVDLRFGYLNGMNCTFGCRKETHDTTWTLARSLTPNGRQENCKFYDLNEWGFYDETTKLNFISKKYPDEFNERVGLVYLDHYTNIDTTNLPDNYEQESVNSTHMNYPNVLLNYYIKFKNE